MSTILPITHSTYTTLRGISASNRRLLAALHAHAKGPFASNRAADVLGLDISRARRLLSYLWERGWLSRIRQGLYTTVPLGATKPGEWREEPWLVASEAFRPCYIAGWSACEHWGLTDQIFRDVAAVTARKVRERRPKIQDTTFLLKVRSADKLFGTSQVWLHGASVDVSDPSRTIVDVLDDPKSGGGIRHVSEVLAIYFASDQREDTLVHEYARRLGNRTVYKRLGYLLEALSISAPALIEVCLANKSEGLSRLDPAIASAGRIVRRWNLRVNATIDGGES